MLRAKQKLLKLPLDGLLSSELLHDVEEITVRNLLFLIYAAEKST